MNRIGTICLTLVLLSVATYSPVAKQRTYQTKCNLTEANSPNIRGIHLGMTTQQVLAFFPGKSERENIDEALEFAKKRGQDTVVLGFEPESQSSKDRFKGIGSLSATLHKGRVVDFSVAYYGVTWTTIDDWIAKLSEAYRLPGAQEWAAGPDETPNKVLSCNGFEIEAAIQGAGASIRVRDTGFAREAGERTSSEDRKRREFKP